MPSYLVQHPPDRFGPILCGEFYRVSVMHVLSTWSVPSAVYFSAMLGETVLVLARASRIEVVRLLEDGLSHVCGTDLWGQITSLRVLNEHVCLTAPVYSYSGYAYYADELCAAFGIRRYFRIYW